MLFCVILLLPFLRIFLTVDFAPILENLKDICLSFSFANLSYYFGLLNFFAQNLISLFAQIFDTSAFCGVYTLTVLLAVLPFLLHLPDYALGEILGKKMSSLTQIGFIGSMIKNIKSCTIYSVCYTLLSLPIFCLSTYAMYGFVSLAIQSDIWLICAPVLMIATCLVLYSAKYTLVCGWIPSAVVFSGGIVSAFAKGTKVVGRSGLRIFSTIFCVLFVQIALVAITGIYGALVLLPTNALLQIILAMVSFYDNQGMRYYVDLDTVLCPKKLEETDKIKKAKLII